MRAMTPVTSTASLGLLFALGCTPPPPTIPARRPEVSINASFNKTWEAAIAVFQERNIPITRDRMSGTLASEGLRDVLSSSDEATLNCGTNKAGEIVRANSVKYRVTVKGDSTSSKLQAAAVFIRNYGISVTECPSSGKWEEGFEAAVKAKAEQS